MNNPPAFPTTRLEDNGRGYGDKHPVEYPGITIRDYFAAAALMGLARSYATGEVDDYLPQFVADDAYRLADAMLAKRDAASGQAVATS